MFLRQWFRPPRSLLALYLAGAATAVVCLGWLGAKLLNQEEIVASERVRERLEVAALSSRANVVASLKEMHPTIARAGAGLQRVVCVAQVALGVVVLASAVLLVRTLVHLSRVDPGFKSTGLLTIGVNLPFERYQSSQQRVGFYTELRQRVSTIPGVDAVALTSAAPFRLPSISSNPVPVAGQGEETRVETERRLVSANYFRVADIRLLDGTLLPDREADAGWVPARRVTRVDPVSVLRAE